MKKASTKLYIAFLSILFLTFTINHSFGQIACLNNLNIALGESSVELTPEITLSALPSADSIVISPSFLDCSQIDQIIEVTTTAFYSDGSNDSCFTNISLSDKKPPIPFCQNLTIDVTNAANDSVWIDLTCRDIEIGSFDNCTEDENLRFTFTEMHPSQDEEFNENTNTSERRFMFPITTEDQVFEVDVYTYVWDESDNSDYCLVRINFNVAGVSHTTNEKLGEFNLYPNPVQDCFEIELPKKNQTFVMEVYNLSGQKVMQFDEQSNLTLGMLPIGIYYGKLNSNGNAWTKKIKVTR